MDMKINPEIIALIQANKSAPTAVDVCVDLPTNSTVTKDGRVMQEDGDTAPTADNSTNTACPPTTAADANQRRLQK